MSVTFLGDTDWKQRATTVWSVDSWGCDHARILYRGSRILKEDFEKTLIKFANMPGFNQMRLERWNNVDMTPSFPGIEAFYGGFKDGKVPQLKVIDGTSIQSVQASGTDNSTGSAIQVSGSFTYMATRTTYIWFEQSQPSRTPKYAKVNDGVNPLLNIITYSIIDSSTGLSRAVSTSAFVSIFNSLVPKDWVTNYETEVILPGVLWGCRADVDYKLFN